MYVGVPLTLMVVPGSINVRIERMGGFEPYQYTITQVSPMYLPPKL
jgi:hypothetical protein